MKKYFDPIPEFLFPFLKAESMKRIKEIGMNCGVEYTSFPLFKNLEEYSRFDHSLGCALLVWRFTKDEKQTLAALFHDIATPVFAHSIDFMNGDYLKQESTEEKTGEFIRNDSVIVEELKKRFLSVEDVCDYHRYPIADNDSPKLSSDRLEYTLGNALNFGLADFNELNDILKDITVSTNEEGEEELCFQHLNSAQKFGELSLACSRIYVSDEDRYAMEMIAELMKKAVLLKAIDYSDLYTTEKEVLEKIRKNSQLSDSWKEIERLNCVIKIEGPASRVIHAKKRVINPYVINLGRLVEADMNYREKMDEFLQESLDESIGPVLEKI